MPSLIQQRFAIDRIRVRALWIIAGSASLLAMNGVLALSGSFSLFSAFSLVVWTTGVASGIAELLRFRRAIREFEAEHGPGSGRQD
ncbi:hypothetical protein [Microbacterium sp. T32]|uniref:hypothetical protein n=1 Tax=Microbacterium sp. T32 TaxID=1776083 RepID=UPI0007ABDE99|nr:hypothetical protein [Microbacterium sp. T32]KZE40549.1 hypothetical protein AVW09_14940 [Microbacterium sp. T32]